jgi:adenine-specific DNA-methyltransferase
MRFARIRPTLARLEDLIASVGDAQLRDALDEEVKALKKQTAFGLVYERHIPETVCLGVNGGLRVGDAVQFRDGSDSGAILRVESIRGSKAKVTNGDGARSVPVDDLLAVKRFGEPIFPTLTSVGKVRRSKERPHHAVVNAENYHALQLLSYCMAGQVDCIYADPPYNTGARDWKYNNDYVDGNDAWRHSKWLSMMEKRLRLARKLLKPDGVLIVTIDENEVHHLGVLLETLFPDAHRQMVSICIQPSGAGGEGLSRVEEYAIFCFLGGAQPAPTVDNMLLAGSDPEGEEAEGDEQGLTWESLLRRGNAWYRARRKNLCYPVLLNKEGSAIVGVGEPWAPAKGQEGLEAERKRPRTIDGRPVAWPVRKDGRLGIWRVDGSRLEWLAERGYAYVSKRDDARDTWALKYLMSGTVDAIEAGTIEIVARGDRGQVEGVVSTAKDRAAKTMWFRSRHNAGGSGGTQLLSALLGENDIFSFPKSVYAVRDCLQVAIGNRQDALILDFFAGSGTTMHATALLNRDDGGRRRSVIVTNNEVAEERTKQLIQQGSRPGDPEWERHGVFEAATRPRCEAAVTGRRRDGAEVQGKYLDGTPCSAGLEENCEFFRLDYLDPDKVELGKTFDALHPLFWLRAGAQGARPKTLRRGFGYAVVASGGYAVLFEEAAIRELIAALNDAEGIRHVFLRTDSEDAYAEMCELIGPGITTERLYGDYLDGFRREVRSPS